MKSTTFQCSFCQQDYSVTWRKAKAIRYKVKSANKLHFCSYECRLNGLNQKATPIINCLLCGKESKRSNGDIKKTKNSFCSSSCAAIYNNAHKTHGTRRSKLEVWLEEQLPALFPSLDFCFNRKDFINSELDIHIPSLNLAFELNGIFHYEPIYGADKLCQIQNNDGRKFQACLEKGIELCIIDSSKLSYFKPANAQKYLDIIVEIINQKLEQLGGIEPLDIHPSL